MRVSSTPGQGARFTLSVPLTLATTRVILVEQSGQLYAIPTPLVERNARVRETEVLSLEGRRAVEIEGQPVPIVDLADVLERPRAPQAERDPTAWRSFFVLRQGERRGGAAGRPRWSASRSW